MPGFAEHADRMAAEHPVTHLDAAATPAERGAALEQVLMLADALRRPEPPRKPEARSIHAVAHRRSRRWRLRRR